MSYGTLIVTTWFGIHEGCEIKYTVDGSDSANFVVSGEGQPFEFYLEVESLRQFTEHATTALAEMDALADKEAERDAREQTEREQAAERPA